MSIEKFIIEKCENYIISVIKLYQTVFTNKMTYKFHLGN